MKTVLIIEDDFDDAYLTRCWLKDYDARLAVTIVRDGLAALEFLKCQGEFILRKPCEAPFLIILDLKLPYISGMDLLNQIRRVEGMSEVPIIVYSGSDADPDEHNKPELGIYDFVRKSASPDQLLNAIAKVSKLINVEKTTDSLSLRKALIVDDDPVVRATAREFLLRQGIEVFEADDGNPVMDMIRKHKVDMVFLDIVMEHKEGIETLTDIRHEYPDLPVAMMSIDNLYLNLCRQLGADLILQKPLDLNQVNEFIHRFNTTDNNPK